MSHCADNQWHVLRQILSCRDRIGRERITGNAESTASGINPRSIEVRQNLTWLSRKVDDLAPGLLDDVRLGDLQTVVAENHLNACCPAPLGEVLSSDGCGGYMRD